MEKGTVMGVGVIICDRRVGFGVLESERETRTERQGQRQRDRDRETETERQ